MIIKLRFEIKAAGLGTNIFELFSKPGNFKECFKILGKIFEQKPKGESTGIHMALKIISSKLILRKNTHYNFIQIRPLVPKT